MNSMNDSREFQDVESIRGSRTCVCAITFARGVAHAIGKGELTSCHGTVWSAWLSTPVRRNNAGEKTGLPARESGHHVVRGRQSSPIPAQQQAVIGGRKGGAPG